MSVAARNGSPWIAAGARRARGCARIPTDRRGFVVNESERRGRDRRLPPPADALAEARGSRASVGGSRRLRFVGTCRRAVHGDGSRQRQGGEVASRTGIVVGGRAPTQHGSLSRPGACDGATRQRLVLRGGRVRRSGAASGDVARLCGVPCGGAVVGIGVHDGGAWDGRGIRGTGTRLARSSCRGRGRGRARRR